MSGLLPSDVDAPDGDRVAPDREVEGDVEPAPGSDAEGVDGSPTGEDGVRVCWLDDEDADTLIGSLSSETARSILTAVHEEPRTASELADCADTSVQNVRHHLGNLQDAGLVRTVGTRYSVKGREMTVYGPSSERLVVAVGSDDDRSTFLDSLRALVGTVALLGLGALFVQWAFATRVAGVGGPATAPRIGDAVGSLGGSTGGPVLGLLSPGVAFLAGGLLVLAAVVAVERVRAD